MALDSAPCREMHSEGRITPVHRQLVSGAKRSQGSTQQQVRSGVEAKVAEVEPGRDHGAYPGILTLPVSS